MVHNDNNIGNSTRIDKARTLNKNLKDRLFKARGGYLAWGIGLIGFWGPMIYFCKQLNQNKSRILETLPLLEKVKPIHIPLGILGAYLLSFTISTCINYLVLKSIGNPEEYDLAITLYYEEVAKIDSEENQLRRI